MTSSCRERGTVEALESMLLEHFLREEPVVGIEYEVQSGKICRKLSTASSCVIKIVEPRAHASLEDLKAIVLKVNNLEEEKSIPAWDEEQIPEEIVAEAPEPSCCRRKGTENSERRNTEEREELPPQVTL